MSDKENGNEKKQADPARIRKAMKQTFETVKKMGAGAAELLKKLKKDKSPRAMLATIETSQAANQERRDTVSAKVEQLYNKIAEKKKIYAAAPPARKRILEAELRACLSEYKAAERELGVLLENETALSQVKGRLHEIMAYDMAGVSEKQIDDVIDEIEESVAMAEGRMNAARDLEKAGRRRERESDRESLLDELAGFDEPADAAPEKRDAIEKELDAFDDNTEKSAEPEPS